MDLILAPDTDVWTARLNRAFKAFFERELKIAEIHGALVKPTNS